MTPEQIALGGPDLGQRVSFFQPGSDEHGERGEIINLRDDAIVVGWDDGALWTDYPREAWGVSLVPET